VPASFPCILQALSSVTNLKPAEVQVANDAASESALSAGNAEQTFQPDRVELLDARALSLDFPTYMIWGANTDVGKTVVSSGLALAACQRADPLSILYVKPVQTGFPTDCDARFVNLTCAA
jgi:Mrp family chromosome partitioning ATPase